MNKTVLRYLRRAAALVLAAVFAVSLCPPAAAAYDMPITLSAADESVYLLNLDTGEVILDQNSDTSRYIASTTKMMTALLLLESGTDLNTTVTVPQRLSQEFKDIQAYNGADIKLKIGENIRMVDLLYGLLLPSANDAASVIADYLGGGSIDAFVDKMNARAAELGCTGTNFTCAHGLYDANNVSTAQDLARIAEACLAIPQYLEVADTLTYTLPADNMHADEREIKSSNPMIDPENEYYRDYIRGIKTGFTTLAGRCFVTSAEKDGHRYLLVILGAAKDSVYAETAALLDWTFSRFSDRTLLSASQSPASVTLTGCDEAKEMPLYPAHDLTAYAYADAVETMDFDLPEEVAAPVAKGDTIGKVTVRLDGTVVDTVDLIAGADYESALLRGGRNALLLAPFVLGLVGVLAVLTVTLRRRRARSARGRNAAPRG